MLLEVIAAYLDCKAHFDTVRTMIIITSKSKELLEHISFLLSVEFDIATKVKCYKGLCFLRLYGDNALTVANETLPFLFAKKNDAEIFLKGV